MPVVVSYAQIEPLLRARQAGSTTAATSPDLGLTTTEVALTPAGISYGISSGGGAHLTWDEAERIAGDHNKCFAIEAGGPREIAIFSEHTHWRRGLMPTRGAPTMLVSGFPMHRIKDTDPWRDTLTKIQTLAPVVGRVLDTATGLGYTAIAAAKTAEEVVTIELDPAGLEIARQNPWSRELFERPNIRQLSGDATELVIALADGAFTRILHDPPMMRLAGDLYSTAFYRQLWRVLRPGGRLFHYIGDPDSPSGKRTTAGVMRRLREAGFSRVTPRPEAFGVTAARERGGGP
ncbi:MAG: methyltransferase domain-containing protein [Ktedonobacterales bacterium]|nr:methyltransferase domain-containing protein [Ktedonobacterales bacterium]